MRLPNINKLALEETLVWLLLLVVVFGVRLLAIPIRIWPERTKLRVTGILNQEPLVKDDRQMLTVNQFSVWVGKYPEYHYGDRVVAVGEVMQVKQKDAWADQIKTLVMGKDYTLVKPKVSLLARKPGLLSKWRERVVVRVKQVLPIPVDGIFLGVVLGDKSGLSADFYDKLKLTGTLHIMVASGMNVLLLAQTTVSLLVTVINRKRAVAIGVLLVWIYVAVVGQQAPVVRAGLMVSLLYLGQFLGRQTESGRFLWLSVLLMVFINPRQVFDMGFQLSVAATGGLIYLMPVFAGKIWQRWWMVNLTTSLAATVATLPILWVNFGQINLLAPVINLWVLWVIPFILEIGLVTVLLITISLVAGKIVLFGLLPALWFVQQSIEWFANIRFVQVQLPKMPGIIAMVYYVPLVLLARKSKASRKELNEVQVV